MSNDMLIIGSILFIFVFLGITLPFVETGFEEPRGTNYNPDELTNELGQEATQSSSVTVMEVISSMFKVFFWSFGTFPFFLEGFFLVLRIILVVTIARNIWVGGGS